MNAIRRSAAVLAAGALLALAACGGDNPAARPVELKEPTWDIASEPSDGGGKSDGGGEPTKTAPDIPPPDPKDFPGMDQKTDEGAEQAARYFISVTFWAQQTGDGAEYKQRSHKDCENCAKVLNEINQIKENHQYWSPFKIKIVNINPGDKSENKRDFFVSLIVDPRTIPNGNGAAPTKRPKEKVGIGIQMFWNGEQWVTTIYEAARFGAVNE